MPPIVIQILRGILLVCASAFLGCGAWLAVEAVFSVRAITAATVKAESAIATSAAELPRVADARLAAIQKQTLELVNMHGATIEKTLAGTVRILDARLASIENTADRQLSAANASLGLVTTTAAATLPAVSTSASQSIASIASDVHSVAAPAASVAAQLNDAAPLYLDCDSGNCLFNHIQGTSRAIDQTMKAVAKAAPQIAESTAGVAADIRREADELTRPKRWWQKLEAWLTLAGVAAAHAL